MAAAMDGLRNRVMLLGLATLLAVVGASCSGDAAREPLRIAYLADLSGDLGEFGPQIQQGVELAIEHLNAAGGVGGQPVELLTADTASDPDRAVAEARRLVEDEGVDAIVGPLGTDPAIAVVEAVSRDLEVPTITPSATAALLSDLDDGGFFFRTAISDAAQGPILAQLVAADLEAFRVAVLFEDSAYGRGLMTAFERNYPRRRDRRRLPARPALLPRRARIRCPYRCHTPNRHRLPARGRRVHRGGARVRALRPVRLCRRHPLPRALRGHR